MRKDIASNTFEKGLVLDFHELVVPAGTYTDALNATFITFNGNEWVLQNDMGNAEVKYAKLPKGFIPIGTCELGGIIYIASYNPLENIGQIGSFPSPLRIFTNSESRAFFNDANFYQDYGILDKRPTVIKTSLIIPLNETLHPGDKYIVSMSGPLINAQNNIYITDYRNEEPKLNLSIKLYRFKLVGIVDNKVLELSNYKWYETESGYYFILDEEINELPYSIFNLSLAGELAILADLEIIEDFSIKYFFKPYEDENSERYYKLNIGYNWSYKKDLDVKNREDVNPVYFTCTVNGEKKHYNSEHGSGDILSVDISNNRKNDGTDAYEWYELNYEIYPLERENLATPFVTINPNLPEGVVPLLPSGDDDELVLLPIDIKPTQRPFESVLQTIKGKLVLEISVFPEMRFGKLPFMKRSFYVDRNKLDKTDLVLDKWKYGFTNLENLLTVRVAVHSYVKNIESVNVSFVKYDDSFSYSAFDLYFTNTDYNRDWSNELTISDQNSDITNTIQLDSSISLNDINVCKIHVVTNSELTGLENCYFYRIIYPRSTALQINEYYNHDSEYTTINDREVRIDDFNNLYLSDVVNFNVNIENALDHIGFREKGTYKYTDENGNYVNPNLEQLNVVYNSKDIEYSCHKYVNVESSSDFSVIANKGDVSATLCAKADTHDIPLNYNKIDMRYQNGELIANKLEFITRIPFTPIYNGIMENAKQFKSIGLNRWFLGIFVLPNALNVNEGYIKLQIADDVNSLNCSDGHGSGETSEAYYEYNENQTSIRASISDVATNIYTNLMDYNLNLIIPTIIVTEDYLATHEKLLKYILLDNWSLGNSLVFNTYNNPLYGVLPGDGLHYLCTLFHYSNDASDYGIFLTRKAIREENVYSSPFELLGESLYVHPNDLNDTLSTIEKRISAYGMLIEPESLVYKIENITNPAETSVYLNLSLTLKDATAKHLNRELNPKINNFKIKSLIATQEQVDATLLDSSNAITDLIYTKGDLYVLYGSTTKSLYKVRYGDTAFKANPIIAIHKYDAVNNAIIVPNINDYDDEYFMLFNNLSNIGDLDANSITVNTNRLCYNDRSEKELREIIVRLTSGNTAIQLDILRDSHIII